MKILCTYNHKISLALCTGCVSAPRCPKVCATAEKNNLKHSDLMLIYCKYLKKNTSGLVCISISISIFCISCSTAESRMTFLYTFYWGATFTSLNLYCIRANRATTVCGNLWRCYGFEAEEVVGHKCRHEKNILKYYLVTDISIFSIQAAIYTQQIVQLCLTAVSQLATDGLLKKWVNPHRHPY